MMKYLKKVSAFSSSWTGTIIIVLFIIFFIAQGFIIPTRSMVGTFFEGDMLFVKKFSYGIPIPRIPWINKPIMPDFNGNGHLIQGEHPKRGDVVVFIPPHERETYYVKRVFGVGGDEIIFNKDGYYLRPSGGDEALESMKQEIQKQGAIAITKKFLDKEYIFEPFFATFGGINYEGRYWDSAEARDAKIAPIEKRAYFFDTQEKKYYTKVCKDTQSVSVADRRIDCDLFEKHYITSPKEFVSVSNITFEEMLTWIRLGMDRLTDTQGNIFFYTKVPENHFFMAGDNRNNSFDSRFWGSVPYQDVVGKPWFIYFSFTKANSEEVGADMDKKERYIVRWERMFKSMDSLNELAKKQREKGLSTSWVNIESLSEEE